MFFPRFYKGNFCYQYPSSALFMYPSMNTLRPQRRRAISAKTNKLPTTMSIFIVLPPLVFETFF